MTQKVLRAKIARSVNAIDGRLRRREEIESNEVNVDELMAAYERETRGLAMVTKNMTLLATNASISTRLLSCE